MKGDEARDRAESIRHRLRNAVRGLGHDVQFALQRYAAERWLHRLSRSAYAHRFVLKGATLYELWGGPIYRPTRDLDFAAYGDDGPEGLVAAVRAICETPVEEDGLVFDVATLASEPIRDQAEYHGIRIRFDGRLGPSRIPMQLDLGFGDAIVPPAQEVEYPSLLDLPRSRIRAYPREAVIAEKLHAMVDLGERNSRLKDFFDVYALSSRFEFEGALLVSSVAHTFERRATALSEQDPVALAPRFYLDPARAAEWRRYLERNRLEDAPADFETLGATLIRFLAPVRTSAASGREFARRWPAGGPWN